jgi:hypothetical protein
VEEALEHPEVEELPAAEAVVVVEEEQELTLFYLLLNK